MVLWELTLATAYVLGLKRTYRLALRAQRRIFGTQYPKIRAFTERRTKDIFTVAMNVHKEIQRRDISVGRSVGNWLLRILDRARPQANIRGASPPNTQSGPGRPSPPKIDNKNSQTKQAKAVRLGNSMDSSLSSQTPHVRRPVGASLRSRITNGLKLRTRPVMGPLPTLTTFGLLGHPVRQHSGSLYPIPRAGFPSRSFTAENSPSLRVLQIGPGHQRGSVFRDDIARLMLS
ncbi:unnamed protein product [Calypogeia fissa]